MNRINKESLKSASLILLLITSLIQVGILWNYQSHGLPFNFLSTFLPGLRTDGLVNVDKVKGDYFYPSSMTISEGYDDPHWVISKTSPIYNTLWNEAKLYMKQVLHTKPDVVGTDEIWSDIVVKKAFIFEFKGSLDTSLLSYFLDNSGSTSGELSGIHKMAIAPWQDVNDTVNTIYILDGTKVYKYTLRINSGGLTKDAYDGIIIKLNEDSSLKKYSPIKRFIPDAKKALFPIRQDILVVKEDSSQYSDFRSVTCTAPEIFTINKNKEVNDLERIASSILGSEKDSYDLAIDDNAGSAVFKSLNNIYRVYKDGLIEYSHFSTTDETERGSMSDAFKRALEFISGRKTLMSGATFYLSGISEEKGIYEFTFDYLIDETPVFFNYKSAGRDGRQLNNAIVIKANGKRVLNCWWVMKNFKVEKQSNRRYDVNFLGMLDDMFKTHNNLSYRNFSIDDISVSYEAISGKQTQSLVPVWVIKTKDKSYYTVPMREPKGG